MARCANRMTISARGWRASRGCGDIGGDVVTWKIELEANVICEIQPIIQ